MNHSIDPILAFFRGGTDHAGRTLTEILAWSDFQLEHEHDYIQWLFPLSEPSRFNPLAPVLVPTTIAAFDQDPALRQAIERGFERLMVFYGFTIQKVTAQVQHIDFSTEQAPICCVLARFDANENGTL